MVLGSTPAQSVTHSGSYSPDIASGHSRNGQLQVMFSFNIHIFYCLRREMYSNEGINGKAFVSRIE